ncbi:MAG: putative lipid II flippase FtsW [Elusimicrobia bacterium]|nr:putative lipid II flippase FtsW [Elusimicrobiota bacterium]
MVKKHYEKEALMAVSFALAAIGLIMILDISSVRCSAKGISPYAVFLKQFLWFLLSTVVFFLMWEVDISTIRKFASYAIVVSVPVLIVLLIPGITPSVKGSHRWIFLTKSIAIQPVEFVKIFWIVYLADYLDRHRKDLFDFKVLVGPLIILIVLAGLVYSQPDFGSTVILLTVFMIVFFLASVPVSRLVGLALLGLPFLYWAVFASAYRRDRIISFLNPFKYASGEGYQLTRSLIAIASGGIIGKGAGSSTSRLMYLPAAHTDFVFSVFSEEFGLLGSIFILTLFVIFTVCGFRMAIRCKDNFSRILIAGLTSLIAFSAFANIAVCVGLLPTKGLALPFMSYGGSNLISTFLAVGLITTVYMESAERLYAR